MSNMIKLVVRKTTRNFENKGVWTFRIDLRLLKRESTGEFSDVVDLPSEKFPTNAFEVEDGLYLLVPTNVINDPDTGYVEECDYRLMPYRRLK